MRPLNPPQRNFRGPGKIILGKKRTISGRKGEMKDPFYLLITTCDHYLDSHLPPLVDGLRESGFPLDQVIVINAQASETVQSKKWGVRIENVTYSALHLTGCYYIALNSLSFDPSTSFLALPCSILPFDNFKEKVYPHAQDFMTSDFQSAPLLNPYPPHQGGFKIQTMDMGFFKLSHLQNLFPYLEKRCLMGGQNRDKLLHLKLRLVCDENKIFGLPSWFAQHYDRRETARFRKANICARQYCCELSSHEYVTKPLRDKVGFILRSADEVEYRLEPPYKKTWFKTLGFEKFQRNFKGPSQHMLLGDE